MKAKAVMMAALALASGASFGAGDINSLRINEVVTNPKSDDAEWEYIELYGCPDTVLTDLALIVINTDGGDEIDEAFWFPTSGSLFKTNSEGYFVIWNTAFDQEDEEETGDADDHRGESKIHSVLPSSITQNGATPVADLTTRHEASFIELQTSGDFAGKISNNGSNSFVLLKNISNYNLIEKDDVISEDMSGDPIFPGDVIDEIAYSDSSGNEYTMSEANEFDYTPGFNPGGLIRCADIRDGIVDSTVDLDPGAATEQYRDAYSNFYAAEIGSNPTAGTPGGVFLSDNSEDSYGAGTYTLGTPNTFVAMEDLDDVEFTPGSANYTFSVTRKQITASGCPSSRQSMDLNDDGVVDIHDLLEEVNTSKDLPRIRRILNELGR